MLLLTQDRLPLEPLVLFSFCMQFPSCMCSSRSLGLCHAYRNAACPPALRAFRGRRGCTGLAWCRTTKPAGVLPCVQIHVQAKAMNMPSRVQPQRGTPAPLQRRAEAGRESTGTCVLPHNFETKHGSLGTMHARLFADAGKERAIGYLPRDRSRAANG